ncbi:MAG: hypothetical protein ABMA64_22970, partial [Myxococcota bacterium]
WSGRLFGQYTGPGDDAPYVERPSNARELDDASDLRAARRLGDHLVLLRTDALWVHELHSGLFRG